MANLRGKGRIKQILGWIRRFLLAMGRRIWLTIVGAHANENQRVRYFA